MVFHPEAGWGGLPTRVQKTKIYLETDEYSSTPPFSKKAFGGSIFVGLVCAGTFQKLFGGNFFKKHLAGTFKKHLAGKFSKTHLAGTFWQEHFRGKFDIFL